MELKDYQQQALDTLERYLVALREARQKAEELAAALASPELPSVLQEQAAALAADAEDYPRKAWENLREKGMLPGIAAQVPEYIPRETASGAPIPHVCLKVPTGGGKTLLGVEAVRRLKLGRGFLLWLVPTKAIYTQTWDAFRNREHPYRQSLDRASGGRVKLLQKDDRFTKRDVEDYLCVMLLMLPATNRNRNKEFLKMFRDSSGYASFFPVEDDIREHQALSEKYPDLEVVGELGGGAVTNRAYEGEELGGGAVANRAYGGEELGGGAVANRAYGGEERGVDAVANRAYEGGGGGEFGEPSGSRTEPHQLRGILAVNRADRLIKQSLFNVLKLLRPTVILDEAHKAYGSRNAENNQQFVAAVNRLNPRFVLELSATPQLGISNILVNVSGVALKEEEMVKLPIHLRNFPDSDWRYTLAQTKAERDSLEEAARQFQTTDARYIRPIAVIRVDRTGKNQRDGVRVHAEDAREELMNALGVPASQIKVKSSEQDELAGIELLSPFCPVRYIITKDALKEGWDCPFAYLLALLDNTTAKTAMTQLIGRVMRQPHARATNVAQLDSCYIYCFNQKVGDAVGNVKKGLEAEGLTGLSDYVESSATVRVQKTVQRRQEYREVDIFLPRVLHKEGRGWRTLNYERDILSALDWYQIGAVEPVDLESQGLFQEIRATIHLQDEAVIEKARQDGADAGLELAFFVRRLADVVPNPWQSARIVKATFKLYREQGISEETLVQNRLYLSEVLKHRLRERIEQLSENIFREKLATHKIQFRLETDVALNYELEKTLEVNLSQGARPLTRPHGDALQLNLFEPVFEAEFNNLEKDFALYLDEKSAIQWWHRIAAKQGYFLQGWRRERVYPDFIACLQRRNHHPRRLLIFETKGQQLEGNSDTTYKQRLIATLEEAYRNSSSYGMMNAAGPNDSAMSFRMLFENSWRVEVNEVIGARCR
ncbi:hypothetical protein C6495_17390 [Candidatus Poribacteria bacterium]|nr:MAG: hypothetical protein C6495_17390 [Candidatus Poribacteria bacterium]